MSVLEISRVDRENQTYDLAALFPNLPGPFSVASVALLPVRTGPSAATVWTTLTVASGSATVLYAGPDADSTGAVVVTGNCDVWVKTTVGSQTDATKAGTIRLAGGAGLVVTPVDRSVPAGGTTGQVLAKASNAAYDTAWVAQTGGGGGGAVSSVNTKTGAVVLSASDVGADAAGAATAAQTAATTAAATDATTKAGNAQAFAVQRANHTGTQAASTVTGLATVATTGAKADVGLGNVDNTADTAKPVSTAQAAALALKQDAATLGAAVVADPTVLAGYGPPAGTLRAALNLGSDLTQPSTSFTDVIQRTVLRLPVATTRWRMRFRNLALTGPITGAISVKDIYIGLPLLGTTKWDGRLSATPTLAISAFTLPADGSEVITPWVTSAPQQFAADTNTALSIAFTCGAGQSVSFGGLSTNHLRFGAGSAAQVGVAAPTGASTGVGAFLDVRLEVEYVGTNRRLMVVSDSTGAGVTDDANFASTLTGIEHAWPNRAAYLNRAICTNASVSGRTLFDFSSLSGVMWTRFDLSVAVPDDAIIALGINDAVQAVSLASYQNFFGTLVGNLRTVGAKRIFATTVMPQPQFKPWAVTATAASGVTTLTTSGAFANADVVDIDYGKATYEQRTVSGASVAVGDGTFTTTLTAATGKAHRAGAAITLVPESLRRSYNDWLRTVPYGLDGLFDIEPLLRDPAGPHVGSPDLTLWGTGVTHPGRGGYERIAYAVNTRVRG